MAMTLKDLAKVWIANHEPDEILDVLLMTKTQQLNVLKAYAAQLRDETQARRNQQDAVSAALDQQVVDLNALSI